MPKYFPYKKTKGVIEVEDSRFFKGKAYITWRTVVQSIGSIKTASKIGVCSACQKAVIDKRKFYGCEGYTNGCRFSLPKTYLSKMISANNIKKLLDIEKSNVIKSFKSKKKRTTFEAILILNADNKLKMEFPQKRNKGG